MDFTISNEQQQMQDTARDFFENENVLEMARHQMDGEDVVDDLWQELATMDYPALTVPLDHGGLGDGSLSLALLLEEAGRVALPAPLPETLAFAAPLIAELGTDEQRATYLEEVAAGERRLSFSLYESGEESLPRDVQLDVEATADGYRLNGTKTLVPFGGQVDTAVVAARTGGGTTAEGISTFLVDTDRIEIEPQDTLDRTRPAAAYHFDDVDLPEAALLGDLHRGWPALRDAIDRYVVAASAMLVGAGDHAVDLSVDHASERTQFGQPIGAFQAVKHRIVDMWMDVQAARSLIYYAAWALENDEADAARATSEARVFCAENLTRVFGDDIQNHGGMGFTWEHDGHIHLKQAKAWETFLGTPVEHLDRIADHSGI